MSYKAPRNRNKSNRHNPLGFDLTANPVEQRAKRKAERRPKRNNEFENEQVVIPPKISKKLFTQAAEQQEQVNFEQENQNEREFAVPKLPNVYDEDASDYESETESQVGEYFQGDIEDLDPEDARALEMFMPTTQKKQLDLKELILSKIDQFENSTLVPTGDDGEIPSSLPPKVIHVYKQIGKIMQRFTHGKLSKPFQILPQLSNWEELLFLTEPEKWSDHAVYSAVKIFTGCAKDFQITQFNGFVLLPRIREAIKKYKKLKFSLYRALKKCCTKAGPFYKGFILPLCESGDCTFTEAKIIASVLRKVRIPAIHSAVALVKISQLEYSGANSLFIRVLVSKGYHLPYSVLDSLVNHFMSFMSEDRQLPVMWHQSLLAFAGRYKNQITDTQREALVKLTRYHRHHGISAVVRRELAKDETLHGGPDAMET